MAAIDIYRKGLRFLAPAALATACLALLFLPGCKRQVQQQTKQQPSQKASTETLKGEASSAGQELRASVKEIQATVEGADNSAQSGPMVNLNYSSLDQLATLPGINKAKAKMIMDNRPYNTPLDLVYKKVITQEEYEKLVNRVVTWDDLWTKSD